MCRPPTLREGGLPVSGLQATNLGATKSVVLAIDRSQSMAGRPLADAIEAPTRSWPPSGPPTGSPSSRFGRRAAQVADFSPLPGRRNALGGIRVEPVEGTALWDGATLAARMLGASRARGRAWCS